MRLPHTNSTISLKRRAVTSGNKKANSTIQTGIPAYITDTGTTADHEQTYLIMLNTVDVTSEINADTDTINDGTTDYSVANVQKRTNHYSIRAIKVL